MSSHRAIGIREVPAGIGCLLAAMCAVDHLERNLSVSVVQSGSVDPVTPAELSTCLVPLAVGLALTILVRPLW